MLPRPTLFRRLLPALVLVLLAGLGLPGAARAATPAYPFNDPRLPMAARVADLLGRLTLPEKISLLHQSQAAIPRLGIPYFKAGTEALHGVAWSNDVNNNWNVVDANGTVFPQAVGLASTWDTGLIQRVGSAVGDEARGYNALNPAVWGLNLWAPVVNLLRDPRWGRNEEGYSEDPTLTGAISTAYGSGIEGNDPRYLKAAPTLKHYLAYNNEAGRDVTSSVVPPRVLNEYDRQAFRPALAAGAATGVMASYNLVNGRPDTVDPDLGTLLPSWAGHDLFNVSDAYAPYNLTGSEGYYATQPEADAAILKAGLNSFTIDGSNAQPMIDAITSALSTGLLTGQDIDNAVRPVLLLRMRLGQFDPDGGPYAKITPAVINSAANQRLNRQTADEAMVLLKNSGGALPRNPARTKKVAVIGPLQNTLYSDWYSGNLPYQVTPLQGIRDRLGAAATVTGVDALDRVALRDTATGRYLTATGTGAADSVVASEGAPTAAAQWDVNDWTGNASTLRNVGNGKLLTGNFGPFNTTSDKPGANWFVQEQFKFEPQPDGTYLIQYIGYETQESWWWIPEHYVTVAADGTVGTGSKADAAHFSRDVISSGTQAAAAAAKGADTAVVVVGSNPFVASRENHDRPTLALGNSQQALIDAVTKANPHTVVVLEDSYPTTMTATPKSLLWTTHAGSETGHAVADVLFGDVNPAGRLTQTWYRSDSDLPPNLFNYDIISSNQTYLYYRGNPLYPFGYGLSYSNFRYANLRTSVGSGAVSVAVDVRNTSGRAGDEVVQLYTHQRTSRDKEPVKALRAFQRVSLAPGQTRTVRFSVPLQSLAHWDVTRSRWVVESSLYDVQVGASSVDIRQQATVRVNGETIPHRDLRVPTRAENFDGYSGVTLVDESKAQGTSVGAPAAGGWISFKDSNLGTGAGTFTARVAATAAGSVQVRLDSPTGPLLGTAAVPATGDVYSYATVTGRLTGARGVHDVYLVFGSALRLATFSIG